MLVLGAIAAVATCSNGSEGRSTSSEKERAADWEPAAVAVADGLVAKLRAADKVCADYTHWSYPLLAGDYERKGLPTPTAAAFCTGEQSENLTFEVFLDQATVARFIDAKRTLLCRAAARGKIDFPGFAYVDGGPWIIEPDEQATAVELARILGGTVKNAGCN